VQRARLEQRRAWTQLGVGDDHVAGGSAAEIERSIAQDEGAKELSTVAELDQVPERIHGNLSPPLPRGCAHFLAPGALAWGAWGPSIGPFQAA